jgi:hypothetical protein
MHAMIQQARAVTAIAIPNAQDYDTKDTFAIGASIFVYPFLIDVHQELLVNELVRLPSTD